MSVISFIIITYIQHFLRFLPVLSPMSVSFLSYNCGKMCKEKFTIVTFSVYISVTLVFFFCFFF